MATSSPRMPPEKFKAWLGSLIVCSAFIHMFVDPSHKRNHVLQSLRRVCLVWFRFDSLRSERHQLAVGDLFSRPARAFEHSGSCGARIRWGGQRGWGDSWRMTSGEMGDYIEPDAAVPRPSTTDCRFFPEDRDTPKNI